MDYEIMRDAENYVKAFCSASPLELKCLNLGFHGTQHSQCKVYVFRLLQIFIVKNPMMSNADLGAIVPPDQYTPLITAYNTWENSMNKSRSRQSFMPIRTLEDELEFINLDLMNRRSTNDKKFSISLDSTIPNILTFFRDKSRKWKKVSTGDSFIRIKH